MESVVWKDIKNYVGYYEISDTGIVRSKNRIISIKSKAKSKTKSKGRKIKGKVLSIRTDSNGYRTVRLSKNGITGTRFIHNLLANVFIPNPMGRNEVNHKNGIKTDNSLGNLEWVTHSENLIHAYATGLIPPKGKQVINTCSGAVYRNATEAASKTGIKLNTLQGYLKGQIKNKTCLQYKVGVVAAA